MNERDALRRRVEHDADRMDKAERERRTVLGHTVFIGALGVLFVLPVVAGAYLGRWLDGFSDGYSVRWTVGVILLGVVAGAVNVYFFIRE